MQAGRQIRGLTETTSEIKRIYDGEGNGNGAIVINRNRQVSQELMSQYDVDEDEIRRRNIDSSSIGGDS